jgi:hypothetical protein
MLPQLTMYTEIPKNYIVPSYYTEAPTYYSIKAAEYYTESTNYYTNKTPDYYTTTYASPSHWTIVINFIYRARFERNVLWC